MVCAWCGNDGGMEGSASRCGRCGGAHWACRTPTCRGNLNAEDRRFCSVCGGARPAYAQVDAHRLPRVTVIRSSLPVALATKIKQDQGFYPRSAEGLYVEGRLILAGLREVLASPAAEICRTELPLRSAYENRTEQELRSTAGLGVLYESQPPQDNLNSPLCLPYGVMLIGGKEELVAVSVFTGEKVIVAKRRSMMAPVGLSAGKSQTEVWTLESDLNKNAAELVRYLYRARPCVEVGRFEKMESITVPDGIAGATAIEDAANGEREMWFLMQDRVSRDVSWHRLEKGALQPGGECGRPRVPGGRGRQRLWESKDGDGIYWLCRSGMESDDGALELANSEGQPARELDARLNAKEEIEFSFVVPPMGLQRARSLDGRWARVGPVHFGWTSITEDDVRLVAEPELKGWRAGWVIDMLGFRPSPGNVGPVLPTPWGFASCAVTHGSKPDLCVIYADFPSNTGF
ncbi:MAG TPA: hypothetical protein VKX17_23530 [Planctomycetota bacterium]|nr:hypothetical protein [Planctomycetota bacterium]